MSLTKKDYDILNRFDFDRPPIGVKYTFKRPERIDRLGEKMTLCEMLKRAQEGNAFYADKNNITCGRSQLGMEDFSPMMQSGNFAAALKVFEEPRSGSRLYPQIPTIRRDLINYVSFSPLSEFSFDPDVLIILTNNTSQTQILLRATTYRTASIWTTKFTNVLGCAWIFVYPYLSGEVNYGIMGLSHGMGRRKLFPEGLQFVSIPYLIMPSVLQALQDMPWVLPSFKPDGAEFFNRTRDELAKELPKHIVA
ncbi:DUF169 domain-containing protein [Chloroflexota bacterium]